MESRVDAIESEKTIVRLEYLDEDEGKAATQRLSTIRLHTSLFEEAARIVEHEYADELSLDDIARRVASSRRQLQRAFAEVGRTTFREHVAKVRMSRAAELLASGSLPVREVA